MDHELVVIQVRVRNLRGVIEFKLNRDALLIDVFHSPINRQHLSVSPDSDVNDVLALVAIEEEVTWDLRIDWLAEVNAKSAF